jgi:hypothetical protein
MSEIKHARALLAAGYSAQGLLELHVGTLALGVDNSQLATGNVAKAVLARLGPVGRTHHPSLLLREALAEGEFLAEISPQVERLAECAELLGPDIHVQSDYGDEAGGRTP